MSTTASLCLLLKTVETALKARDKNPALKKKPLENH
jgi:hypothetical protein